jgi:hypothetical protein
MALICDLIHAQLDKFNLNNISDVQDMFINSRIVAITD